MTFDELRRHLAIGSEFRSAGGRFRVTDIGSRTILAIRIDDTKDESWLRGPPYAVAEIVFDENDHEAIEID